jgi:hypothetical protein
MPARRHAHERRGGCAVVTPGRCVGAAAEVRNGREQRTKSVPWPNQAAQLTIDWSPSDLTPKRTDASLTLGFPTASPLTEAGPA